MTPKVIFPSDMPYTPHRKAAIYPNEKAALTIVRAMTLKRVRSTICPYSRSWSPSRRSSIRLSFSMDWMTIRCWRLSCRWLCTSLSVSRMPRVISRRRRKNSLLNRRKSGVTTTSRSASRQSIVHRKTMAATNWTSVVKICGTSEQITPVTVLTSVSRRFTVSPVCRRSLPSHSDCRRQE